MANRDLERLQKRVISILANNEKDFQRFLVRESRKTLRKIRDSMLIIYEKFSIEGKLTRAEMTKFNRLKNLEKELSTTMRDHGIRITRNIKKFSSVEFNEAFFRYDWSIDQASGVSLKWGKPLDLKDVAQLKQVGDLVVSDSLLRFSADNIRRMQTAVMSGIIRGDSLPRMSKAITRAMEISTKDALRITRTETHRVTELGHHATFLEAKKLGVRLKKQLLAVLDNRTRPQSAQMDGQISNEDGLFRYPDGNYYLPGNTGNPAWDINDREDTIDIIDDYAPRLRRTRDEGIQPFITFNKWADQRGLEKNIYNQKLFGG